VDLGIIRWSGGGVTSLFATSLVARNDKGMSIGNSLVESNQPILVSGNGSGGELLLELNGGSFNNVTQFTVSGINLWGSIVGWVGAGSLAQGFKLWSNAGVRALNYPDATATFPSGINDNGTVVGSYSTGGQQQNGFIYQNGQWATLNFPHATSTVLAGISNSGMIIGNAQVKGSSIPFIYTQGAFKTISVPKAAAGSVKLLCISAKQRLVLGTAGVSGGTTGFITSCQ
jgi:probable HAF family extracellular repeat protein